MALFVATTGNDSFTGTTADDDAVSYAGAPAGVSVDLSRSTAQSTGGSGTDLLLAIDALTGSAFGDALTGNGGANRLAGEGGNDVLTGSEGNDTLEGGAGADTLYGGLGDDTYVLRAGDGSAVGSYELLREDLGEGSDTLRIVGLAPADVRFTTSPYSLYHVRLALRAADGTDSFVEIYAPTTADGSSLGQRIERLVFDDGTIWDLSQSLTLTGTAGGDNLAGAANADVLAGDAGNDALTGYGGNDTLTGGAGADNLTGGVGNDTLDGGTGADTLYGNAGDDIYVLRVGDGSTVGSYELLREDLGEGSDTLRIVGLAPADVRFTTSPYSLYYVRLALRAADGTDSFVEIYAPTTADGNSLGQRIERVVFDDGTTWDLSQRLTLTGTAAGEPLMGAATADVLAGGDGNDALTGNAGDDTLEGGAGADTLYGNAGDDSYVLRAGDGSTVDSYELLREELGEGTDTLRIVGLTPADVRFTTSPYSSNYVRLALRAADGTDSFVDLYAPPTADGSSLGQRIERVVFDDGTTWDLSQSLTLTGTAGSDNLTGAATADVLAGDAGNDALTGYGGNDTLTGGAGTDNLTGGAGNDTLDGGTGADTLYGNAGDDSYVLRVGDGSTVGSYELLREDLGEGSDTLRIVGLAPADVRFTTSPYSLYYVRLALRAADGTDSFVEIYAPTTADGSSLGQRIERVVFDDGTTWDLSQSLTLTGTAGSDNLAGAATADVLAGDAGNDALTGYGGNDMLTGGSGADTLYGNAGNDTLDGGTGADTLYGNAGDDTYVLRAGDGSAVGSYEQLREDLGEGSDTLRIVGVTPADVRFTTGAYNSNFVRLALRAADGTDSFVELYAPATADGNSLGQRIERVVFDDGTIWDLSQSLTLTGTAGAEALTGAATDDVLTGAAGNDTLYGNAGDDTLEGGAGTDTLYGNAGNDTYILRAGDGATTGQELIREDIGAGIDTLLILGASAADLSFIASPYGASYTRLALRAADGSSSHFDIYAPTDADGASLGRRIERIVFEDGSVIPLAQGAAYPVAVPDSYRLDEDGALTVSAATGVLANDSDPDGAGLAASVVRGVYGGTLTLAADGSFTYTPRADFTGTDSFVYAATDAGGERISGQVTLVVQPQPDAPVAAADAVTAGNAGSTLIAGSTLTANDHDADPGDTLTVVAVPAHTAAGASLTLNNGNLVYDPSSAFAQLLPGQTGVDSFSYAVSDASGRTSEATVSVTVTGSPITIEVASAQAPSRIAATGLSVFGYELDYQGRSGLEGHVIVRLVQADGGAADAGVTVATREIALTEFGGGAAGTLSGAFLVPGASLADLGFGQHGFRITAELVVDDFAYRSSDSSDNLVAERVAVYSAVLDSHIDSHAAGDVVTLTGHCVASSPLDSVAYVPVAVEIVSGEHSRVITAIADAQGQFRIEFTSLPGTAGSYSARAYNPAYPGEDSAPEAGFALHGIDIVASNIEWTGASGQPGAGSLVVHNTGATQVTGLELATAGLPAGWTIAFNNLPDTLAAGASATVGFTLTTPAGAVATQNLTLTLDTDQGAHDSASLLASTAPAAAHLVVSDDGLDRGVLRGDQTVVSFNLTNAGGEDATGVVVQLPGLPWMRLAGDDNLGVLHAGETRTVTLLLSPDDAAALGTYAGDIHVRYVDGSGAAQLSTANFDWNLTSDETGSLSLRITDEYSYFAAEHPLVSDAVVRIVDAVTGQQVARFDNVDGTLQLDSLNEGSYVLSVSSANHSNFTGLFQITEGSRTELRAFVPRETVTYHWTVVEGTVEERTHITLDSTFQTDVPVPVVTMDPPILHFGNLAPGETEIIEVTITNHGLIAALNVDLNLPDPTGFSIDGLIEAIPVLPAKTSMTIPITISRDPLGDPTNPDDPGTPDPDGSGCSGHMTYEYNCNGTVVRVAGIAYDGCSDTPVVPVSNGAWSDSVSGFVSAGGGGGGGGGSSGGGGGSSSGTGHGLPGFSYSPIPVESVTKPCGAANSATAPSDCVQEKTVNLLKDIGIIAISILVPQLAIPLALLDAAYEIYNSKPGEGQANQAAAEASLSITGSLLEDMADGHTLAGTAKTVGGHFLGALGSVLTIGNDINDLAECLLYGHTITSARGDSSMQMPNSIGMTDAASKDADCGCGSGSASGSATGNALAAAGTAATPEEILGDRFDGFMLADDYVARASAYGLYLANLYGDIRWFDTTDYAGLETFAKFVAAAYLAGVKIEDASVIPVPKGISAALVDAFVARFNRTIDYWDHGIHLASQLPEGANPDFYAIDVAKTLLENAIGSANLSAEAREEIARSDDEMVKDLTQAIVEYQIEEDKQVSGVCATIKLRIEQDLVMERQAFFGTLELTAGETPLQNLKLEILIFDKSGNLVDSSLFGSANTSLQGIASLDGTAGLAAGQTLNAEYLFLPSRLAAALGDTGYSIGGKMTYLDGGASVAIDFQPVQIEVHPSAELQLDYYYERNVVADDPFTDEVEDSQPFLLGVRVTNSGRGKASDVRIESAQPEIIDNQKGLLIDFSIIGSQVDGQAANNGLTAHFGDIAAGQTRTAIWSLEASLQGKFIDYTVNFEHVNELGMSEVSQITDVRVHELIHGADFNGDGGTDFLINDFPDLLDQPDKLHLSGGQIVDVATVGTSVGSIAASGGGHSVVISAGDREQAWGYLSGVLAGAAGQIQILSVMRADGSLLDSGQFWITDRTFANAALRPVYETRIHVLDDVKTAQYTVVFNGEVGPTTISGGAGNDSLAAESGATLVLGLDGNDSLIGNGGDDTLEGGSGDDVYFIDNSAEHIVEAADDGIDSVRSSASFSLAGTQIENLVLTGSAAINGTGNDLANMLSGNSAANELVGAGGNDSLNGGAGVDTMTGGTGNDLYFVDNVGDRIVELADAGIDSVRASVSFSLANTQVENLLLTGTSAIDGSGNDLANSLTGNAAANRLLGGKGNDTLAGGAGNDTLDGGLGADRMSGGTGNDVYIVDNGGDRAIEAANAGNDSVQSSVSFSLVGTNVENLTLTGISAINASGNDLVNLLIGNAGANRLQGGRGNDSLTAGAGNDTLDGGTGADQMTGGTGNDIYIVDNIGDRIVELPGAGTDGVQSSIAFSLLDTDIENLTLTGNSAINASGNGLANILTGNGATNRLQAGGGNDILSGGGGNDTLDGGAGADDMAGGTGNDVYIVDNIGDHVAESAGGGTDTVQSSVSFSLVDTVVENLILTGTLAINGIGNGLANTLTGNGKANRLQGGGGNDVLTDSAGNDTLDGGAGADRMTGGVGNDLYIVDNLGDRVIEAGNAGVDSVQASVSFSLAGTSAENLALTGSAAIDGSGNGLANILAGNDAANWLRSGGGNDVLNGGAGGDRLEGGSGADKLTGGIGADVFAFTHVTDSGRLATARDTIVDFRLAEGDVIDLSEIDASFAIDGNQAFTFIGRDRFTDVGAQLRYTQDAFNTYLYGDVDGDLVADFSVCITGLVAFGADNFIL
ncbi:Ig-like domain-containing protein [Derxia lacustris]|uniref:Ig-like domain-containing protein n=1 Tax=Derxia lacustris TaxID=764842 RepID=UPI000A1767D2|nr:tandem-95 repeat protein [Derxia lacustris]